MELREKNEAYIEREKILMEQIAAEEQRQLELAEYEKYVQTKKYVEGEVRISI